MSSRLCLTLVEKDSFLFYLLFSLFLVLFMSFIIFFGAIPIVLFLLTFKFIYSTFNIFFFFLVK